MIRKLLMTGRIILCLLLINTSISFAGTENSSGINADAAIEIHGRVTDERGLPIENASVILSGSRTGTVTDAEGYYKLSIRDNQRNQNLEISSAGYKTKLVNIGSLTEINIILERDVSQLSDVVVVGYGTEKKQSLTGSISTVSGSELSKRQIGQTSMALQGMAPCVTITQRSGQPGADGGSIRIRGIGTLNNSNPLVLVDGIESDINIIDVNSISSISILKDASASAIYGSKAANGVILITTRRGTNQNVNVNYNGYMGISKPTNLPKMVNGLDHITMLNEAYTNAGRTEIYSDDYIQKYISNRGSDEYPETNWQDAILNGSGLQTNHSVSISGGSEKVRVFSSLGYLRQNGLLKPTSFERYSFRVNSDLMLSKKLKASLDLFVNNQQRDDVAPFPGGNAAALGNLSGIALVFGQMVKMPAIMADQYSNGNWAEGQNGSNPAAIVRDGGFFKSNSTPIQTNLSLEYTPWKSTIAKITYAPSFYQSTDKSFVNALQTYYASGAKAFLLPGKNTLLQNTNNNKTDYVNVTVTVTKKIDDHNFKALGGFQFENYEYGWFNAFRDGFLFPDYQVLSAGSSSNMQNDGSASAVALQSYFGRVNYSFKEKYLFEGNLRYDGSSRFAEGQKWGVFPSFSVGWRISEEDFMTSTTSRIQNLKIRGSWGKLGNQNIGSEYPFASTVSLVGVNYISDGAIQNGAALTTLANRNISWESAEMTDVGIDFTIFKKLSGSFDYYIKKTTGILLRLDIPKTMGLTAPFQNAGVVQNKGWDLQLDYKDNAGQFNYGITFNMSDVKNKIIDLHGIQNNGVLVNHEGHAINSLFLYHATGLITKEQMDNTGKYTGPAQFGNVQPGDIAFENLDGNDVINENDKKVLGSTIPRFTYGFLLYLNYKHFDLSGFLQGVGKVDGYLSGSAIIPFLLGGTAYEYQKNRWTTENPDPNAIFPRLAFNENNNTQATDFYMKSAAYLRFKNVQLGYSIPENVLERAGIKTARVFISAENIFTLDKFWKGWDPEASPNSNGAYYPQVKSYNIGLSLNF